MMTNMQNIVNEIKTAYENGYRFFGIRNISTQMYKLNVGDTCPNSYDWDFEYDRSAYGTTGETLNGASAIHVNTDPVWDDDNEMQEALETAIEQAKNYYDGVLYLIASKENYDWGSDENEIVLEDATVIAIVNH